MESPMAAGFSDEMAAFYVVIAPEARYPAFAAMSFPLIGIEQPFSVDGRNEFIAVLATSFRKVVIASQFQTNFFQSHRFSPSVLIKHGPSEIELP
jgi:hypothetical protein